MEHTHYIYIQIKQLSNLFDNPQIRLPLFRFLVK